ncbi:MAG: hypothetical protein RIS14_850 [Pseudomonadota bacterium]
MVKQILNNPVVRGLWIAFLLILAMATIFGLYAYSEHEVDRANDRPDTKSDSESRVQPNSAY